MNLLLFMTSMFAAATPVPWILCGEGLVSIRSVDMTPWPPVSGAPFTFTADVIVKQRIPAANYDAVISVDGIPLIHETGDLCTLVKCPVLLGPLTVQRNGTLPAVPPTQVELTLQSHVTTARTWWQKLLDSDGALVLCAKSSFVIGNALH